MKAISVLAVSRAARLALAGFCLTAAFGTFAQSSAFPSRPIKFIVPLPPGGGNDLLARIIAERMGPAVGQPVVVENKPGAGGNIGTEYAGRQPADGHTILITSPTHIINPNFFAKLPYDPIRDFTAISLIATIPFVLTVNSSVPAHNVKELIALARAQPGKLTYATAGIGTPHHLSAEMLRSATGIDILHIPYKGAGALVPALVAGEVNMTIGAINSLLPHIRAGRLRALAVTDPKRTPVLPEVPTIAEGAGLPDFSMVAWFGVLAPAGTPENVVRRLNSEINRIIQNPQVVKERLTPVGLVAVGTTPEAFAAVLKTELVKYVKVAKDAGIKPE